jgi:hypothetical protein
MAIPNPTNSEIKRFFSKVDKSGPCWVWIAHRDRYGVFSLRNRVYKAHRVSYVIAHGVIPDGMQVCHHCDNPACVKPDHLFLGSQRDNMADCARKGRYYRAIGALNASTRRPETRPRGEGHPRAVLTVDRVRSMRDAYTAGDRIADIARCMELNVETVRSVVHRRTWKHVA